MKQLSTFGRWHWLIGYLTAARLLYDKNFGDPTKEDLTGGFDVHDVHGSLISPILKDKSGKERFQPKMYTWACSK